MQGAGCLTKIALLYMIDQMSASLLWEIYAETMGSGSHHGGEMLQNLSSPFLANCLSDARQLNKRLLDNCISIPPDAMTDVPCVLTLPVCSSRGA